MKVYGLGILGCGDFTRIQSPTLLKSRRVRVAAVHDPNARPIARVAARARRVAGNSSRRVRIADMVTPSRLQCCGIEGRQYLVEA